MRKQGPTRGPRDVMVPQENSNLRFCSEKDSVLGRWTMGEPRSVASRVPMCRRCPAGSRLAVFDSTRHPIARFWRKIPDDASEVIVVMEPTRNAWVPLAVTRSFCTSVTEPFPRRARTTTRTLFD